MIYKLIKSGLLLGLIGISLINNSQAQDIQIPDRFEFAGINLKIKRDARKEIEARVNAIHRDTAQFHKQIKVADLYLPLIEDILEEAGLPEDFKYLSLMDNTQPDSLLFWKMASQKANELGLTTNFEVDERLNILTASKAIAKHLKNNQLELKNWIFTLLSYHLEVDKVKTYLREMFPKLSVLELLNLKDFDIDLSSHPDIITFLSYHFAFRPYLNKNIQPEIELISFDEAQGKSISDLAQLFSLPESALKNYNSWLKTKKIPSDKSYEAIIPMPAGSPSAEVNVSITRGGEKIYTTQKESTKHIVRSGETLYRISRIYGVEVDEIKEWNNLTNNNLNIGQVLVLENTAQEDSPSIDTPPTQTIDSPTKVAIIHVVEKGETLYKISRKYNVEVIDIKEWNNTFSNDLYIGQKLIINVDKESLPDTPATPSTIGTPVPSSGGGPDVITPAEPSTPKPRTLGTKTIPSRMNIGDISLIITKEGEKLLEKEVKRLIRHEKYFFENLQRVDLYAPLIKEALAEQGVPLDLQYLPIQESEMIANAVSRSQAVGYWQFKAASAREVGMIVNGNIDERMHIIQASQGAAKYLLRSQAYFKNWIFTLLSFNMGFTGAKNHLERQYPRQDIRKIREVKIDSKTHWYVIKFLAHKIAFEEEIGIDTTPYYLRSQTAAARRSLRDISREKGCDIKALRLHNQWLKSTVIPTDKTYSVLLPLK